jgi:acetyl-CoA synthetase
VVGKPDALRTEIVKAFIVLNAGFSASEELAVQLQA